LGSQEESAGSAISFLGKETILRKPYWRDRLEVGIDIFRQSIAESDDV
jgi:hypothetical protein